MTPSLSFYWRRGGSALLLSIVSAAHAHRVLIVDDDEGSLEALVAYLEAAGFTVAGAASGAEALERLREGMRPCALVVDVVMPAMDGWTLVEHLQADPMLAALSVILYSGTYPEPERARRLGVRRFFLKPVEPQRITDAVAECCPRRE